jgi:hypothetical protein
MAIDAGAVVLDVVPDTSGFSRRMQTDLGREARRGGRFSSIGAGLGKSMVAGFAGAFAAVQVFQFFGDAVAEAEEAQ